MIPCEVVERCVEIPRSPELTTIYALKVYQMLPVEFQSGLSFKVGRSDTQLTLVIYVAQYSFVDLFFEFCLAIRKPLK